MRNVCFHRTNEKPSWIVWLLTLFCGVVIPGSGGIRKVRFGFGARGKSGGARIIYLFSGVSLPAFILAVFAKNEKANVSAADRNALGKMVVAMIEDYRRQK
jgi:hypothetical protein